MYREEILADKVIVGVKVKSPSVWLQVQGGGWIHIEACGDCCSDAFIDAVKIDLPTKLTGQTVDIDLPSQETTQEYDEITAVRFFGDKGGVAILHRNSSNGYYGNFLSIKERGEPPEDAVDGRNWHRIVFETTPPAS